MIDDLTLSMEEARKAGLLDGMTKKQIQDRANRRAASKQKHITRLQGEFLPAAEVQARQDVCKDCDGRAQERCLDIRREQGCGLSLRPWASGLAVCPRNKWDHIRDIGKELEVSAQVVIERNTFGRVLELGTGGRRGTEAALVGADYIITVDNMKRFALAAEKAYAGNDKVMALHCPLKNGTYDLPTNLGVFDTIIVDGPRGTKARDKTLEKVIPMLSPKGKVIIDDEKRDSSVIDKWAKHFGVKVKKVETTRGMAILTYE